MNEADFNQYSAAINEDLGRQINERITERIGADPAVNVSVLCECSDADCQEAIELPMAQYDRVRQGGSCFLVITGHERPGVERVVSRDGALSIVEKTGEAGRIAEEVHSL